MLALPSCLWLYIEFFPAKAVSLHLAARCSSCCLFTPSRLQRDAHPTEIRCHCMCECVGERDEMSSCREASGIRTFLSDSPPHQKLTIFQRIYVDLPARLDKQRSRKHPGRSLCSLPSSSVGPLAQRQDQLLSRMNVVAASHRLVHRSSFQFLISLHQQINKPECTWELVNGQGH